MPQKPHDPEVLQRVVDVRLLCSTSREAAQFLGLPDTTFQAQLRTAKRGGYVSKFEQLDSDQLMLLREQFKILSRESEVMRFEYAKLQSELESMTTKLVKYESFETFIEHSQPTHIQYSDSGTPSESVAVLVASDWHIEETIEPETVNDLNKYDLDIATTRAQTFFQNGLKVLEMFRSKSNIKTLVFAILGDFITGYIHDELMEMNQLSPVKASLRVFELLVGGIDFLLEHGDFDEIIVVTSVGNHGRTTRKPRVATSVQNNFEWLIYQFLATHYHQRGDSRIKFQISEGYFNYLQIYQHTLRFHHGNAVRYMGGIGGVHIPLNKAIAQWDKAKRATLDVLGHWHTLKSDRKYVINGSLIGYSPFAISIKADYEPPMQACFLIHPHWGKTVEAPIFVE